MDDFKEFLGKDLDTAISEACKYYNTEREQLEIEIVRDAKSGIFGIVGSCKACIRARRAHIEETVTSILEQSTRTEKSKVLPARQQTQRKKKSVEKQGLTTKTTKAKQKGAKKKVVQETAPVQEQDEEPPHIESAPLVPAQMLPDTDLGDDFTEELVVASQEQLESKEFQEFVLRTLQTLIDPICGENVTLTSEILEGRMRVHIESGEDDGLLIGREGQTLMAVQYLLVRIVLCQKGVLLRIQLDAGEYRQRQEDKLQELAQSLAEKVRLTGKTCSTRPLSSYHRRIVHMCLQEQTDLVTRSIGDGVLKRVVVMKRRGEKMLKKPAGEEQYQEGHVEEQIPNGLDVPES